MKTFLLLVLFSVAVIRAEGTPPQCEEIGRRAAFTLARIDSTFKLKTGMLLGEIQLSKTALLGCVDQNRGAETRASLLWFLTDIGLLLTGVLGFFHQRRMRKAIFALNLSMAKEKPGHSATYLPSQWYLRSIVAVLVVGLILSNTVALFL